MASTQWSTAGFKVFFAPEIFSLDSILPSSSPLASKKRRRRRGRHAHWFSVPLPVGFYASR